MIGSLPKLPTVTPAFLASYPDGWLNTRDMAEIFGLASAERVHDAVKTVRLPPPDRRDETVTGRPVSWSWPTVAAEMVRRIEKHGVTV